MAEHRRAGTTYPPTRSLVLCAAPRTGSTLLCELLTGTDVLGYPKEPFAPASVAPCCEAWGTPAPDADPDAYLRAAVRDGTSPDGTFSTKIMWDHLDGLRRWGNRRCAADVFGLFAEPHALVITRRDKVAAAVSWVRARATGEWSRNDGDVRRRPEHVDLDAISAAHRSQHEAERGWHRLLAEVPGVPSAALSYEDVADGHRQALRVVAGLLGRGEPPPTPATTLAVQRDAWSEEVAARWTTATGGCEECRPTAATGTVPR